MDEALQSELLATARAARAAAYAPYSNYLVGAALLAEDGRIFGGCNVENAAYPQGVCAEAGAISAMVLAGQHRPGGCGVHPMAQENSDHLPKLLLWPIILEVRGAGAVTAGPDCPARH